MADGLRLWADTSQDNGVTGVENFTLPPVSQVGKKKKVKSPVEEENVKKIKV